MVEITNSYNHIIEFRGDGVSNYRVSWAYLCIILCFVSRSPYQRWNPRFLGDYGAGRPGKMRYSANLSKYGNPWQRTVKGIMLFGLALNLSGFLFNCFSNLLAKAGLFTKAAIGLFGNLKFPLDRHSLSWIQLIQLSPVTSKRTTRQSSSSGTSI